MQQEKSDYTLAECWQTAAFTGAAFGGKLRQLKHYRKQDKKAVAPAVSKDEFERKLAEAERMAADGTERFDG
ncbi:MAG: hypothetical protein QM689_04380 [Oscillospiraceae bacterium]